jgi:hypothetical protein
MPVPPKAWLRRAPERPRRCCGGRARTTAQLERSSPESLPQPSFELELPLELLLLQPSFELGLSLVSPSHAPPPLDPELSPQPLESSLEPPPQPPPESLLEPPHPPLDSSLELSQPPPELGGGP